MRSSFIVVLCATIVFTIAYQHVTADCQVPLTYHLGNVDERFNISAEEAKAAIARAEAVWETPLGQDLFRLQDSDGKLSVSFVYDERQAEAEAEYGFRERLNTVESVNDEIRAQYEELTKNYEELKANYEAKSAAYERRLNAYNETVNRYNAEGGAPPDAFAELERERTALERESGELSKLTRELNTFVDQINLVGKQGNLLVEKYNEGVGEYNRTFGDSREFTQGDYRGKEINIYTFTNEDELVLVLAHELGHALGIEHVEGRESIMYYLIGEQPKDLALSGYDKAAFTSVCTPRTLWDRIIGNR